ncbi:MAG: hypothetical protein GX224_06990 [Thermoplasmatales archaeon]|nr:hypothetical protein [Thermoplasmatales archaeon]
MDNKQIMSLLVLVGALIAVVGIFLNWVEITVGPLTETITGWKIMTDGDVDVDSKFYVILAFVFALIVLIGALINLVGMLPEQITAYTSFLLLIFGILILGMALGFWAAEINGEGGALVKVSAGAGLWLTLVGGILVAIPGILALLPKK